MFKTVETRKVNYPNGTSRLVPTIEIDFDNKKVRIEQCASSTCNCINHKKYGIYAFDQVRHMPNIQKYIKGGNKL